MSLTKCLKQLGITGADAKTIRASVKDYLDEGMSQGDAAIAALEGFVGDLQQSREDIVKQLPVKEELFQPVYHGTPHKFDEFTLDHMGTGEGAQAYGWGLYFADRRDVAEFYREQLAPRPEITEWKFGSVSIIKSGEYQDYSPRDSSDSAQAKALLSEDLLIEESNIIDAYLDGDANSAKEHMLKVADERINTARDEHPEIVNHLKVFRKRIAEQLKFSIKEEKGQVYKVDIPKDQDLLNYDAPLTKQPKAIKEILKEHGIWKRVREAQQDFALPMNARANNGGGLYELLAFDLMQKGDDTANYEAASKYLNSIGIPGLRYKAGQIAHVKDAGHNYVIFNEEAIETLETFYQDKRGAITFPAEGIGKDKSVITLLEDADLSTFLHETGHFFFEVYRDIAADPNAPEQIRADMSALLDFVGVDSLESWNGMSIEERRAGHEKVAEAFEVYLFEGKAPTTALQSLFQSFRAWLKMTYRSMTQYLSPDKITPEVRQVFDRMLATDEAIADAEKSRGFAPLFTTQEEAGATDKQWAEYQENLRAAHEKAVEEVEQKGLKDMKWLSGAKGRELKKLQAQANAARKVIKDKVTEEMNQQTAYRAMHFLRKGYFPGEEVEGAKPVKLDSGILKERYGEEKIISDPNVVNPETDELLVAIAKLGGLTQEESEAQGIDPENWKGPRARSTNQPVFGKRIFRKEGLSFDAMAEALVQDGYLTEATPNDLLDQIDKSLAGESQYSNQYSYTVKEELLPWQKLSRMKLTSKEGVDPDNIAEVLGFTSGDEMVRVLIAAPPLADSVNMETNRRMIEEHGELSDKEALNDAANIAVHNNAHARFLASEGKFLAKLSKRRAPDVRLAKETATKIIAQTKVANIRPAQFEQIERKESKAVIEAWKKNKPAEASDHAQKQLLNFYLAKYAREAKVESEKILKHAKKYQKAGVRKSLRGEHLEQLDALLARFDFRRSTAPKSETAKRREQNLQNYLETESERIGAAIPDIAPWILDESHREHYSQLTMEEMRGLYDTFRQLDHLARRENKMYIESRNMSFQQEEAGIVNEFRAIHPEIFDDEGEPIPYTKGDRPYIKELKDKLKSKFDAEFVNMENLLDIMTVGRGKQIFSSLFGRLSNAADKQTKLMKELAKFLEPYTTVYSIKERATFTTKRTYIPEVGKYLTRDQMISVALNYGNAEGRQRLMEGHKFTDGGIKTIISHLDARDMAFVDALWRMSDEIIWPKLEALDKRTKGIAAKKVEPIPFVTAHGEARGGYVPLVYDGDTSTRSYDINTDQSVQELLGGSVRQAATLQGASKERVAKVNRELDLSISAISYKINETVHDVTHREAVADTWRLLRSDGVSTVIRKIGGPDVLSALMERVRETAVKPIVPRGIVERGLWYLRKNTLVNMMGASFNTVAINILGASPAIRRVGGGRYLRMIQKLTSKRGIEYYKEVLEKSPYMAQRIMSFERDMSTEINRFVGREGLMPSLATWFIGLSIMDRMVTMPAWMAAYEIGLTENDNNEQDAVEFADRVVRQTQGSGRVVDLAKVAGGTGGAGEFKRIITMFYSFFNAQLGQMMRGKAIAGREWSEKKRAKAAMRITLDTFAIIIVPAMLEALARGQCKDDEYLYCAGQKSAMFTSAFFPIMRDVVPFIWAQYDPDLYRPMRISPIESALETMGRTPKAATDIVMGEATEADYRTLVRGLGYGFGLPGFQAWRTIEGYQALVDGETDNPAVLLTGVPYEH